LKGIDYKDANGHRTFGYGLLYHPNGNYMDQVKSEWTQTELEQLYKQTVDNTRNKVLKWAKSKNVALKDNQIDALTSAVYNFGPKFLEWSVAKRIAANPNDEKIYDAWAKFSDH
jgi:GH24 family phage-related lysozyme (muramidase)